MKKFIQMAALVICLSMVMGGCANDLPPKFPNPEKPTKQSAQFLSAPVVALSRLANDTAYMIGLLYSPAKLNLSMNIAEGDIFGERLRKSLEAKGFSVYTGLEKTYQDVDLVYVLKSNSTTDGTDGCYLHITMSNGFDLCQAYRLDPQEGFVIVSNHNNPVIPYSLKGSPDINDLLEKWSVNPGSLEQQMGLWCKKNGYSLVWNVNKDFIMPVHTQFQGTFELAVQSLFAQMNENGNSIDAHIYRGNKVLEVQQN